MRTAGQVLQKLKQAQFRHVKKEVSSLLKRTPNNCANNVRVQTPSGEVGVCKLYHKTCDANFSDLSESCSDFTHLHGKEEIKASLKVFFSQRSVADISVRYPDVAALLWVLEDSPREDFPEEGEEEVSSEEFEALKSKCEESERSVRALLSDNENLKSEVSLTCDSKVALEKALEKLNETLEQEKQKNHRLLERINDMGIRIEELQASERTLLAPRRGFWERFFR